METEHTTIQILNQDFPVTAPQQLCEIANCREPICGKQILIQDYGSQGKWLADVCQKHYDSAHPTRKQ